MSTMRSTLTLDPKDPNLYYCEGKVITEQGGNGVTFGITDVKADGVRMNSSTLKISLTNPQKFINITIKDDDDDKKPTLFDNLDNIE